MKRTILIALLLVLAACTRQEKYATVANTSGGNADRGRTLINTYGCNSCHIVPGVDGPKGMVGPSLEHMATRQYIAGKFPNKPDMMMKWLRTPQGLDPATAMPNLGVTAEDSRDMTAYLYSLK